MSTRRYALFRFVVLLALLLTLIPSCTGGAITPTPGCPPAMSAKLSPPPSSSDVTGCEIKANIWAKLGGQQWCGSGFAVKVYPATTPTCPWDACLAKIDVQPDGVDFAGNSQHTDRPLLRYDLISFPAKKDCSGSYCLAIYQLVPATKKWDLVDWADIKTYGGRKAGEGHVKHFTVFALVEVPPPQPAARPQTLTLVVASDFIPGEAADIAVAMTIVAAGQENLRPGEERIFLFRMKEWQGSQVPDRCTSAGTGPDQLTCAFPIGTEVVLDISGDEPPVVTLKATQNSDTAVFRVDNVEVF